MPNIDLILKAIEFIESHLTEDISVADMAESVSFSLFHFSRIFSRSTRHTPYDYLMRRRLCEAAQCLMKSEEKIIDIAYRYKFKAPETFSRAFKRMFNLQPRQVRLERRLDQRQLMGKLVPEYLEFLNSGISLKPEAKNLRPMQITGIAAPINANNPNLQIEEIWKLVGKEIQASGLKPADRDYLGLRMFFTSNSTNQYIYFAGTSLVESERAPHSFVQKSLPGLDYACFELPEKPSAASFVRKYVYHSWWPKITNAPLATFEIEFYSNRTAHKFEPQAVPVPQSLCFPLSFISFNNLGNER